MFKKKIAIPVLIIIVVLLILFPQIIKAAEDEGNNGFNWTRGLIGSLSQDCSQNGNCDFCDFIDLFILIANVMLALSGGLALLFIVISGISFITAAGNPERVTKAKKAISSTVLGIIIVLVAWVVVQTILVVMGHATSKDTIASGQKITLFDGEWWRPCKSDSRCSDKHPKWQCTNIKDCLKKYPTSGYLDSDDIDTARKKCVPIYGLKGKEVKCDINLCPGDKEEICCGEPSQ